MPRTTTTPTTGEGRGTAEAFTAEERAAMKERAREVKAARSGAKVDPEQDLLAKIAELPEPDRSQATRIHELVREHAPSFAPRTWYGMPAWGRDGKATVFFQPAAKFKARYATLGFNDDAVIDDGAMWPTSYALTTLGPAEEERIVALLRRASE